MRIAGIPELAEPTFRTSSGPQGVLMAYAETYRDLDVIELIEVIER